MFILVCLCTFLPILMALQDFALISQFTKLCVKPTLAIAIIFVNDSINSTKQTHQNKHDVIG